MRVDAKSGQMVWQRIVVTAPLEHIHNENSFASSSPATDGQRIYTSFAANSRVNLQAYDFSGAKVWETEPTRFEGEHGYSYAPGLSNMDTRVVISCIVSPAATISGFLSLFRSSDPIRADWWVLEM